MKQKNLIPLGIIVFTALLISFASCKKEDKLKQISSNPQKQEVPINTAGRFQDSMSVSSYGFLNFLSVENLDDFLTYIKSHNHRTVKAYLDSLGFTSRGHSIYGSTYDYSTVTANESLDYLYNPDYVFEVERIILRPISPSSCTYSPWEFLLAMNESNLSSTSYEYLQEGTYDAETMNQFAANPQSQSTTLFDFMAENPSGNQETEANECPTEEPGRPFIGWNNGPNQCVLLPQSQWVNWDLGHEGIDPTYNSCHTETYYFVIKIRTREHCDFIDITDCANFIPRAAH